MGFSNQHPAFTHAQGFDAQPHRPEATIAVKLNGDAVTACQCVNGIGTKRGPHRCDLQGNEQCDDGNNCYTGQPRRADQGKAQHLPPQRTHPHPVNIIKKRRHQNAWPNVT